MSHARSNELAILGWMLHAAGLCSLITGAGTYWVVVYQPTAAAKIQVQQRIVAVSQLLKNRDSIRQEYERLTSVLDCDRQRAAAVRQQVPDDPSEAEFLRQLSNAAAQGGVAVDDYNRGMMSEQPEFSQLDVHVDCSGTFKSICRFLEGLEKLPRVSEVVAMEMTSDGQGDQYPLHVTIRLYFGVRQTPAEAAGA